MDDVRLVLEQIQRQVRARPGSLERVLRRHRRQRRNQRLAAATVALSIAVAGAIVVDRTLRFDGSDGRVPAAPVIESSNAAELAPAWTARIPGVGRSSAVESGGVVYVASIEGSVYALDGRTGRVAWTGRTEVGAVSQPVVAGDQVFVHAAGTLYAFASRCGGVSCPPEWSGATGSTDPAPPAISGDTVYVTSADGHLLAFDATCDTGGARCDPLEIIDDHAHLALGPTVADWIVWDPSSGALSAFPTTCARAAVRCDALVAIDPGVATFSSGVGVGEGIVSVGASDGSLYVFPATCASVGRCDPLWRGRTGGAIIGTPLVEDGRVYIGSNDGRLYAFPASCRSDGGTCRPLWVGQTGGAIEEQPVIAGGLVFASSVDGRLYAFPQDCRLDGSTCAPALVKDVGALPPSPAIWADRVLLVASAGTLTAYTVDGAI